MEGLYQAVYVMVRIYEVNASRGIPGKRLCRRKLHLCCYIVRNGDLSFVETYGVPELLDSCQVLGRVFCGVYEWLRYVVCKIG